MRLDKYLWAVRLYKTRTLAAVAIRAGHVTINGLPAKTSREVKIGDTYQVKQTPILRTVKVVALLEKRVGPKLVAEYAEDLTPASEYLKQIRAREPFQRDPGAGRPTKRDRRALQKALARAEGE
jgi:ribosome-associated heat shock protein Hsp15